MRKKYYWKNVLLKLRKYCKIFLFYESNSIYYNFIEIGI